MICEFFKVLFDRNVDLRGKELKYAKELLLNHCRKPYKFYSCGCRACV